MPTILTAVVAVVLALMPAGAFAVDRFVNPHGTCPIGGLPQHATIQGAIDSADPGDQIGVCPGTYREIVTVPADKTAISITGLGRVIVERPDLEDGGLTVLADDVRIEKLELRGFNPTALTVTANRATIRNNRAFGVDVGIFMSGDGHRVHNNFASARDGGIVLHAINGADVSGNRARSDGTGIATSNVDLTAPGTVIHHNIASGESSISMVGSAGGVIRNNTVRGMIFVLRTTGAAIVHNMIRGGGPFGLMMIESHGCTIGFNAITFSGGGIDLLDSTGCTIQRNNVFRNFSVDCIWDGRGSHAFLGNACATETPDGAWD
jgi:parallel beta-helix repeat protein